MQFQKIAKKKIVTTNLVSNAENKYLRPKRIWFIGVFLVLWGLMVVIRLVQYQLYDNEHMQSLARQQQQKMVETSPKRGVITDRDGHELARSIEVSSIYVTPAQILNPKDFVDDIARILQLPKELVLQRLTSQKVFVSLKRKVEAAQTDALRKLNIPGLEFVTETKRFYPKNELASNVLGFVSLEEEGFAGVEQQFDKHLRGNPGKFLIESDAKGRPFSHLDQAAESGQSLVLTLDERIQYQVEKILNESVLKSKAKGATAIVMEPKTGEILAMASTPGFNPNSPIKSLKEAREMRRNRAVEDAYEPGSVFKIVTYSAALEEGILSPDKQVDCQGGMITIGGHTISDGGRYGLLTASEAFAVSSNVAAIKTGKQLGKDRLLKYVQRFGFGQKVDSGLPAESSGNIGGISKWTEMSYASLPMGYEIIATPIQIVAAISSIANEGVWMQPHIVRKIISTTGDILFEVHPSSHPTISLQTAKEMKGMLQGVIEKGTAKLARLNGYTAGGKTGTAKKFDHALGRYSEAKYFATFAGIAPINKPEIAIVVVIDEPPFGQHHGGQAAAPVFKQIAETILPLLGVVPDSELKFPNSMLASTEIPEESDPYGAPTFIAQKENKVYTPQHIENVVVPMSTTQRLNNNRAAVTIGISSGKGPIMPNLIGQGIRTAASQCAKLGIKLNASGFGTIKEQSPLPGTSVDSGSICYVKLNNL